MLTTTTNKILAFNPCNEGWEKLTGQCGAKSTWTGTDDILAFADILKTNKMEDGYWALRVIPITDLNRAKFVDFASLINDIFNGVTITQCVQDDGTGIDKLRKRKQQNRRDYIMAMDLIHSDLANQTIYCLAHYVFCAVYWLVRDVNLKARPMMVKQLTVLLTEFINEDSPC